MTLDDEAEKVEMSAEDKLVLATLGGMHDEIVDFIEKSLLPRHARRCAEAMREECAKVVEAHAETQGVNVVLHVAQAIRRVEMK